MDKCNCKLHWDEKSKFSSHCTKHDTLFYTSSGCPYFQDTIISTPESNSKKNKSMISNSSSSSSISRDLVVKSGEVVVKSRDLVVQLKSKGWKQDAIAKEIGKSQQYVSKILNLGKDKVIRERFHNLGLKFNCVVNWDNIKAKPINLRNKVSYKQIELVNCFVRVFKKSITIILKEGVDVIGLTAVESNKYAFKLISDIIELLPSDIVVQDDVWAVISRHNAFMNHPIANKWADLKVYDNNGRLRFLTDKSHGKVEGEFVDKDFCVDDSTQEELRIKDQLQNPFDLPSVLTSKVNDNNIKLNLIVETEEKYAHAILKHLDVEERKLQNEKRTADVLEQQNEVQRETLATLKAIQDSVKPKLNVDDFKVVVKKSLDITRCYSRDDIDRKDRIRSFIDEFK